MTLPDSFFGEFATIRNSAGPLPRPWHGSVGRREIIGRVPSKPFSDPGDRLTRRAEIIRDLAITRTVRRVHSDDLADKEEGQSPSPVSSGTGFGSKLFSAVVEGQLRGTAIRSPTPEGLAIAMRLPLSSLIEIESSKKN